MSTPELQVPGGSTVAMLSELDAPATSDGVEFDKKPPPETASQDSTGTNTTEGYSLPDSLDPDLDADSMSLGST